MKRLLSFAGLTFLLAAPAAAASTGTITRAYADPSWTRGSFAGHVDWSDCNTAGCKWLPVATVQPTLPVYHCLGDEVLDSDPNTYMVWSGGSRTANGVASFDVSDVPILYGVQGQRLCLSVIETRRIQDPVCLAQAPILGMDPASCPLVDKFSAHVVGTTLMSLAPPPPQPAPPATTPLVEPNGSAPLVRPARVAKRALARRFGKRWTRGHTKRLNCRVTVQGWRCPVSWRYRDGRYMGKVLVSKAGKPVVRVKGW